MAGRRNEKFDALVADTSAHSAAAILEQVQKQKIKVHPYFATQADALLVDNAAVINQDPVFSEASNEEICTVVCVVTDRLYNAAVAAESGKSYMGALYQAVVSQPAKLSPADQAYATLIVRVHTRSLVEKKPTGRDLVEIMPDALLGAERGECSDHEKGWVRAGAEIGAIVTAGILLGTAAGAAAGLGALAQTGATTAAIGASSVGAGAGTAVGVGSLGALYRHYRKAGRKTSCLTAGCTPDERSGVGMYCVTCGSLLNSLQTSRFRTIATSTAGWVDFLMQQFALLTAKKRSGCVVSLEALAVLSLLAHTARNKRRLAGALDALLD